MADSTHFAILEEMVAQIKMLGLTDIPQANIKAVKVEHYRETIDPGLPGVHVMPFGSEILNANGGTTCRDDIGYPCMVLMYDIDRQDTGTGLPADALTGTQDETFRFDEKLHWRQQIRKRFHNQRLPLSGGYPNVYRCVIEPSEIVRPVDWLEANLWIGGVLIRAWTREERL
jgi:hypothetical protein